MAGSGKTTLMSRLHRSLTVEKSIQNDDSTVATGYYVNLDPATKSMPFGVNIDIRDTVNYKEVMKQVRGEG